MQGSTVLVFLYLVAITPTFGQKGPGVEILQSGTNTSLRGMSIPSDNVVWVSGSNGIVGKTTDAGKSWKWITIPGFEKRDFRDIEAFDSTTAIVMAVDNPAYILKTTDGGNTWKKVFERVMQGMFLDAMDFRNKMEGICIGDPLNLGQITKRFFYILQTFDGGETWTETNKEQLQLAEPGEAIFAASGTNITFLDHPDFDYAFVTGGSVSKLYLIGRAGKHSKVFQIPIEQGKPTAGTFSFVSDKQKLVYCIGGDYNAPVDNTNNFCFTSDAGYKWKTSTTKPPGGYRSCIQIIKDKLLVACGPSGVDLAANGQKGWENISSESFNVCMVSKNKQVYFAGEKGKIGRLVY